MEVQFSEKAKRIEEGIFALLNEKKTSFRQREERSIISPWEPRILSRPPT